MIKIRKLASIKKVSDIIPIDGKDRIVLAIVDGWQVIVQKDEFNIGDKCVFCEIDSVLPEKPEFEFLRKKGFRIKTMKMAGVISQGICFPMSILPEGDYYIDDDVTDIIGVTQYEETMDVDPEVSDTKSSKVKYPKFLMRFSWFRKLVLKKTIIADFPDFISKTDETRVQNIPYVVHDKREWIATEKIDGTSGTFCLVRRKSKIPFVKDRFEYIVCSRNKRLVSNDGSIYWQVSDKFHIEDVLHNIIGESNWVAIQGECIGPKIQKNKYKKSEPDMYVFNLVYPTTGRLGSLEAREICVANSLKFVPIIDSAYVLPDTVNEILEYAHGKSMISNSLREGIVFRSKDGKTSFKAVDPLFLINYDE